MNLIEPSIKLVTIDEPGKRAEYCGRVCYNSADKITPDSHVKFLQNIYNSGHTSVLEHENVAIEYKRFFDADVNDFDPDGTTDLDMMLTSTIPEIAHYFYITVREVKDDGIVYLVSSNIRGWLNFVRIEEEQIKADNSEADLNDLGEDEKAVIKILNERYPYLFPAVPGTKPHKNVRYIPEKKMSKEEREVHTIRTFEVVTSRSVTHQWVRHRTLSFSQQSQRYCNYSGTKFGHSVNFIKNENESINQFYKECEEKYFSLIDAGLRPENAREVLPNGTASILMVSGTPANWKKFFNLRCDDHAQKEIRELAMKARDLIS